MKFIELAVYLGRGKVAREGLFHYKNTAQSNFAPSIEVVVKKFVECSREKLESAQKRASQTNLSLLDDLEAAETPESIMMNSVSSGDPKDRTDRQVVTPCLRFLWETYRTVLDVLRNNSRLEELYQVIYIFISNQVVYGK